MFQRFGRLLLAACGFHYLHGHTFTMWMSCDMGVHWSRSAPLPGTGANNCEASRGNTLTEATPVRTSFSAPLPQCTCGPGEASLTDRRRGQNHLELPDGHVVLKDSVRKNSLRVMWGESVEHLAEDCQGALRCQVPTSSSRKYSLRERVHNLRTRAEGFELPTSWAGVTRAVVASHPLGFT